MLRRRYRIRKKLAGEGLMDILSSLGSTAKMVDSDYLAPALKYAGKNADSWAPPLMNAASNLIAAKINAASRSKIENMIKQEMPTEPDLTDEEFAKIMKELTLKDISLPQAPRALPHKTGYMPAPQKFGTGLDMGLPNRVPKNVERGLRMQTKGSGLIRAFH